MELLKESKSLENSENKAKNISLILWKIRCCYSEVKQILVIDSFGRPIASSFGDINQISPSFREKEERISAQNEALMRTAVMMLSSCQKETKIIPIVKKINITSEKNLIAIRNQRDYSILLNLNKNMGLAEVVLDLLLEELEKVLQ